MNKRKESLPSPVKLKKAKDVVESAPATPNTLEEQRKKAKEWFDKEEKKKADAIEAENAKRSITASETPSKKAKFDTKVEDDEESVVSTRSTRRRSSITSVSDVEVNVKTSRTPSKARRSELPPIEEDRPAPPSARKAPKVVAAKLEPVAVKKPAAIVASSPKQSSPAVSPKITPKATTPKQASPVPVQLAPASSPKSRPAAARSPTNNEKHPEVTALVELARAPPGAGNNLNPPPALLTLMLQAYILIGGVAYFNPKLGLGVFIAVNVLANLFLMGGVAKDE